MNASERVSRRLKSGALFSCLMRLAVLLVVNHLKMVLVTKMVHSGTPVEHAAPRARQKGQTGRKHSDQARHQRGETTKAKTGSDEDKAARDAARLAKNLTNNWRELLLLAPRLQAHQEAEQDQHAPAPATPAPACAGASAELGGGSLNGKEESWR